MKKYPILLGLPLLLTISACSNDSEDQTLRDVKLQNAVAKDLKQVSSNNELLSYLRNGVLVNANQAPTSLTVTPIDAAAPEGSSDGYSETNLQVDNVNESDVIKYDGSHLFVAMRPQRYFNWGFLAANTAESPSEEDYAKIRVMATTQTPPSAQETSIYQLSEPGVDIEGFYRDDNDNSSTLSVVTRSHSSFWAFDIWFDPWYWSNGQTGVHLLDASNPMSLTETFKVEIEGHLIDSRKIGDNIYLVTRYTPMVEGLTFQPASDVEKLANQKVVDALSLSELLPKVKVNGEQETSLMRGTDCYIPEETENDEGYGTLVSVTTININTQTVNSKCISGYNDGIFASKTGVYLLASGIDDTAIHKLGFAQDDVAYFDTGFVKGNLGWRSPSFRLGEHGNVLRVLSSYFDETDSQNLTHRLTLFSSPTTADEGFQPLGVLPNDSEPAAIGKPGEDIFAVRYVGDRGYAVTFERIDPLYVFDLSNPTAPKISGELEVTGVSQQLHPVGENFLIGIGHDVNANTQRFGGVKIELFDVSDLSNPKSVDQIIYGKSGSSSVATFNHHAYSFLSLDETNHRLALPVVLNDTLPDGADPNSPTIWYEWTNFGLQLLEINTGNNPELSSAGAVITATREEQNYPYFDWYVRSVLHNNAIYFSSNDKIWAGDWQSPEEVDGPH